MEALNIAYIAGLLEGEGCFSLGKNYKRSKTSKSGRRLSASPRISVSSTDEDVILKAASILKAGYRYRQFHGVHKTYYSICIFGPNAIGWMMTIYILMGVRRKSKIREIIDDWKSNYARYRNEL